MNEKLLIIDDDNVFCSMLRRHFEKEYEVAAFTDPQEAVRYVKTHKTDAVLTDLSMPEMDGLEVLRTVRSASPATDVIIMTAYAQAETAVEAMKLGAYDYIIKPFTTDELSLQLKNLFEKRRLSEENLRLRKFVDATYRPENIIGKSEAIMEVRRFIEKVSQTDFPVLITGESGTGKELTARAIHFSGKRKESKFLLLHCSALSQEMLERELFGYEAGMLPDSDVAKTGLFEEVGGGTIVLDDIEEMSPSLQARLLEVIEKVSFQKMGDAHETPFEGMIIAIAGRDLRDMIRDNNFREDLFYRLNMFSIRIPPLRERKSDIPALAEYFFSIYKSEFGRDSMGLSKDAVEVLKRYGWPGNVRELKGLFAKICLMEESDMIGHGHILARLDLPSPVEDTAPLMVDLSFDNVQRKLIAEALERTEGNVTRAAKELNIGYDSLRYRIKKYGIDVRRKSG